jgi:hypothetical protein
MPAILHPDLSPLIGSWRLLALGNTFCDTGERVEPFGPNPDGCMVLEPGGRIMFLFATPNRQPILDFSDNAGLAALLKQMMAYTGLVRWDGPGRFITTVDLAHNPAWGGEQVRLFTIDGDRLTIRTPEQAVPRSPGRLLVGDVTFVREHPEP